MKKQSLGILDSFGNIINSLGNIAVELDRLIDNHYGLMRLIGEDKVKTKKIIRKKNSGKRSFCMNNKKGLEEMFKEELPIKKVVYFGDFRFEGDFSISDEAYDLDFVEEECQFLDRDTKKIKKLKSWGWNNGRSMKGKRSLYNRIYCEVNFSRGEFQYKYQLTWGVIKDFLKWEEIIDPTSEVIKRLIDERIVPQLNLFLDGKDSTYKFRLGGRNKVIFAYRDSEKDLKT